MMFGIETMIFCVPFEELVNGSQRALIVAELKAAGALCATEEEGNVDQIDAVDEASRDIGTAVAVHVDIGLGNEIDVLPAGIQVKDGVDLVGHSLSLFDIGVIDPEQFGQGTGEGDEILARNPL